MNSLGIKRPVYKDFVGTLLKSQIFHRLEAGALISTSSDRQADGRHSAAESVGER